MGNLIEMWEDGLLDIPKCEECERYEDATFEECERCRKAEAK